METGYGGLYVDLDKMIFMNNNIYQIAIKKEYAATIIEDLKLLYAIDILEQPIPAWQQEESIKRLVAYHADSSIGIEEDTFFNRLKIENEKI